MDCLAYPSPPPPVPDSVALFGAHSFAFLSSSQVLVKLLLTEALLAASSGVTLEDDPSGAVMNQRPPLQSATGANVGLRYLRISPHVSDPISQKVLLGSSTEIAA